MKKATFEKLDDFTKAYMACALWSSMDIDVEDIPLDRDHTIIDIEEKTAQQMVAECKRFQEENAEDLATRSDQGAGGHDFWLTRNGHGTGFWDGDWQKEVGERLTSAAHKFGEQTLCVHNGKIVIM